MDFLFVLKSDNINGQKIEKKWKTYVWNLWQYNVSIKIDNKNISNLLELLKLLRWNFVCLKSLTILMVKKDGKKYIYLKSLTM
jgi:hypothetical protein